MRSTHVRILIAGILLSVCPPIVAGQTSSANPAGSADRKLIDDSIADPRGGFLPLRSDVMVSIKRNLIASLPDSLNWEAGMLVSVIVQVRLDGTFLNPDPKVERSSGRGCTRRCSL